MSCVSGVGDLKKLDSLLLWVFGGQGSALTRGRLLLEKQFERVRGGNLVLVLEIVSIFQLQLFVAFDLETSVNLSFHISLIIMFILNFFVTITLRSNSTRGARASPIVAAFSILYILSLLNGKALEALLNLFLVHFLHWLQFFENV